jgi:hypothetical protein
MEDMVVVAGLKCTNAVLVELVCAGPSRRTAGWMLRVYRCTHSVGVAMGDDFACAKARVASGFGSTLDSELSCTDEDDIAVIARKLPYCCRYIIL